MTANTLVPLPAGEGPDPVSLEDGSESPTTPRSSSSFSYPPLSTELDFTRFVQIDPVQSDDEPVSCRLVQIAFGDRPRFDALSYMWGDCGPENLHTVLLNGVDFHVGKNLWDALRHLRREHQGKLLWIDAICIDQNNIAERNRQVRMMDQIYFRAQTVIVWLGSKYAEHQRYLSLEDLQSTTTGEMRNAEVKSRPSTDQEETSVATRASSEERQLAKALLEDGYWDRLWIIQEVAQARVLKVSFGTWDWTWDNLVHFLTVHNIGDAGPLKLNRQLREARATGFSICQLFKDHHRACCKDRRDMVYGLVGLAMDVCDFPIDYAKSLIEIWTDTMECLNDGRLLAEENIVPMGQLIKNMLMGHECGPLDQVRRIQYEAQDDSLGPIDVDLPKYGQIHHKKVFRMKSSLLGFIASTDPSTRDIVAKMAAVSVWNGALLKNFPEDLGPATSQSNALLRGILDSNNATMDNLCFGPVSNVRWRPFLFAYKTLYNEVGTGRARKLQTAEVIESEKEISQLIQLTGVKNGQPGRKMGIASPQARPGDLVCSIPGVKHCVTVRLSGLPVDGYLEDFPGLRMQILGTSLLVGDTTGVLNNHGPQDYNVESSLEIMMDARTLFVLL